MDPALSSKPFPLAVTSVRHHHGLVQVLGTTDPATASLVERYLTTVQDQLEGGTPPQASGLEPGQGVVVRREGLWHRARVLAKVQEGKVQLLLMDQGITCTLGLGAVRTEVHSQLSQVGQEAGAGGEQESRCLPWPVPSPWGRWCPLAATGPDPPYSS